MFHGTAVIKQRIGFFGGEGLDKCHPTTISGLMNFSIYIFLSGFLSYSVFPSIIIFN